MKNLNLENKSVVFAASLDRIEDIGSLPKIGAGHDGIVFRREDTAIKWLKHDIPTRLEKKLMTFQKALLFTSRCIDFKRSVVPFDVLLDDDGYYVAYAMNYIHEIEPEIGSFPIKALLSYVADMEDDYGIFNEMHVEAKDINPGSYLYTADFVYMCDFDKFVSHDQNVDVSFMNLKTLNYAIARLLYLEMVRSGNIPKEDRHVLTRWIKASSNSNRAFITNLNRELGNVQSEPISEYTESLKRRLIKK